MSEGKPPCRRGSMRRSRTARSPRSPATSPAQYPAASGVGVSILLHQAHGFEGIGAVRKDLQPDHLAVAQLPDMRALSVDGCTAALPPTPIVGKDDDVVTVLYELLGLASPVLPG